VRAGARRDGTSNAGRARAVSRARGRRWLSSGRGTCLDSAARRRSACGAGQTRRSRRASTTHG
jgi:hypothetical protein